MLRKIGLALAAVAAIRVGWGAASSAEAGHPHRGHHGGHHDHYDDYHHHHHHHAGYRGYSGYGGYGFGYSGPTNVRSIYGPSYQSFYGTRYSGYRGGYGYGGRGYDNCYGPSYGRGGVSISFGF
jgi:hypothetical protein